MTKNSDITKVAAKGRNIGLDPLQRGQFIQQTIIAGRSLRSDSAANMGNAQKAPGPKTIIHRDEDHAFDL